MLQTQPYYYRSKTLLIQSYRLLDRIAYEEADDSIFDLTLDPTVANALRQAENGAAPLIDRTDFSGFSQLSDLSDLAGQKVYLLAEVFAAKNEAVLIHAFSSARAKLWSNNDCVTIHNGDSQYYVSARLKKGLNRLVWEFLSPTPTDRFSLQLLNYAKETGDDALALCKVPTVSIDLPLFVSTSCFAFDASQFEFMYLLGPCSPFQERFSVRIEVFTDLYEIGHSFSMEAKAGQKLILDLDKYRSLPRVSYRPFNLVCTFYRQDGTSWTTTPLIFPDDYSDHVYQICEQIQEAAQELDTEFRTRVNYLADQCRKELANGNLWTPFVYTGEFEEMLEALKKGKPLTNVFRTPGIHKVYVPSELDDTLIRIIYKIPEGYDPALQYPAFFALTDGSYSELFPDDCLEERCLCFDINTRGSTGGAYVGEASIMSIYRWINKNFSIDPDRRYFLGGSQGGYATWAFAQNYPDVPAAIYPHISSFSEEKIHNLSNTPVFYLHSDQDYVNAKERQASSYLKSYHNYRQYELDQMLHHQLIPYLAHPFVLKQMLACRRNPYPDRIIFSTRDNRHLKSFWLQLHGIQAHKKIGRITARIENPHLITLRASNIVGFSVEIPPQIDRSSFVVRINRKDFRFTDYKDLKIDFIKKSDWRIGYSGLIDCRKGLGLLDVYMDNLRVVFAADSAAFRKAAEVWANPNTNGGNHIIHVHYPFYDDAHLPDGLFGHNLILAGLPDSNRLMKKLAPSMPVSCSDAGYRYLGEEFEGDYVVMQVFGSPFYPQKSVLTISSNREALLGKVLFLRKLFIPYNFNGVHPYLNNEILVYREGRYFAAYEAGEPLQEIPG